MVGKQLVSTAIAIHFLIGLLFNNSALAQGVSIRVEAEVLSLNGFVFEDDGDPLFSGGRIKLATTSGSASGNFPGSSGNYDVTVRYFDEADGISTMSVSIAGVELDAWFLSANTDQLITHTVASGLFINANDLIEIAAQRAGGEFVRIDYIEFVPLDVIPEYNLTVNVSGSGNILYNPPGNSHLEGTVVSVTAIPTVNWFFDDWTGDINSTNNPLTFTMDSDKVLTANFFTNLPVITSIFPSADTIGAVIEIRGFNFTGATEVKFSTGKLSPNFTVLSDTVIQAEVPVGAITGPVTIKISAGTSSSAINFVVILPPDIVVFSPQSEYPGLPVTITGTNLAGVTTVSFDGVSAAFDIESNTEITAIVPANATTGKIMVSNSAGSDISDTDFTVIELTNIRIEAESMQLNGFITENTAIPGINFSGERINLNNAIKI